jgi:DNA-directed RNA polymerase subunit RPC12/RpoP
MASPCPRCGATKTESVRHGLIYDTLWKFGYHLRCCSSCKRWRLFKQRDPTQRHPDDMTLEELRERYDRKLKEAARKASLASEKPGGKMASDSSEESRGSGGQPSKSSVRAKGAGDDFVEYRLCPKCGSTHYHRSRRRWYERLIRRRRMARCMKCNHRFPYPL